MLECLREEFESKKILILGFGREGKSSLKVIKTLCPNKQVVIGSDNEIECDDASLILLPSGTYNNELGSFDLILKSPGFVLNEKQLKTAKHLSSQSEIFIKHFKKQIIGITGTKGKSTTSSLIYHLLKSYDDNVLFGGNIGIPCFDLIEKMNADTKVVLELSCHQLEFVDTSVHLGVILNLYEEHLDRYHTFEKYIAAKNHLCQYQDHNDLVIVNKNDMDKLILPKNVVYISMTDENSDIYVNEHSFTINSKKITIEKDATNLLGNHNIFNIAVAYYICVKYFLMNEELFFKSLKTFNGLAHRLEKFARINDVDYYDDSISTANETAIEAIKSIDNIKTIIIGGMDREISYDILINYLLNMYPHNVIFMYASGHRIYQSMLKALKDEHKIKLYAVEDLKAASALAKQITEKNGACVLSPAAASYDHFKNFEERGALFQAFIKDNI